jgi:hypothetical protein
VGVRCKPVRYILKGRQLIYVPVSPPNASVSELGAAGLAQPKFNPTVIMVYGRRSTRRPILELESKHIRMAFPASPPPGTQLDTPDEDPLRGRRVTEDRRW